MKRCKKYAAMILLAVLMIGIFSRPSEVQARKAPKYRPYIKERSIALTEGQSTKLTIEDADEYKIAFKSDDTSVAKVSKTGKITAVNMGQTNLRVTFSVAGVGSKTYTVPVKIWKKPFKKMTKTHTIEPGMQCQVWLYAYKEGEQKSSMEITVKSDSEDESLMLHVFGLEENPSFKYYPGCPLMQLNIEVDEGYITTKTREKKIKGPVILSEAKKVVWIENESDEPAEVSVTAKLDDKSLKWFVFQDVELED